MTSPQDAHWNRAGRYLAGELSAAEQEEFRRWLEEHPDDARMMEALDRATRDVPPAHPADVEAALRRLKIRRAAGGPWRSAGTRVAATVAAAGVIAAVALYATRAGDDRPTLTYATQIGQTDTVALEGASLAILGPDTRIQVRGREIDLAGDAFFIIRENASGYVVRAGDATVRDIGTDFGVQSWGRDVRVVVASGLVELETRGSRTLLDSGDVAQVAQSGLVTLMRGATTPDDVAWTRGLLVLRDAPMTDVARALRRWFGVHLLADSAPAARRFTGTFSAGDRGRAGEVIALAVGARAERRGDTVWLRAAPAAR